MVQLDLNAFVRW